MRTLFTTLLVVAVFIAVVLDGIGMFLAYQSSHDVARTAAQQAAIEFVSTRGNVQAAQAAAEGYAHSKDVELVRLDLRSGQRKWFEAETKAHAETYLLHYIPVFQDWVDQKAVAQVSF
jgi:hypothetical protein